MSHLTTFYVMNNEEIKDCIVPALKARRFVRRSNRPYLSNEFALTTDVNFAVDNARRIEHIERLAAENSDVCWFFHYEVVKNTPEQLKDAARLFPSVMRAINCSRVLRRVGVSGVRISNCFARGRSSCFVTDCLFQDWYACAAFVNPLFQMLRGCMPSHISVELNRMHFKGRFVRKQDIDAFLRDFYEKSGYCPAMVNTFVNKDGFVEFVGRNDGALPYGLIASLMRCMRGYIVRIYLGGFGMSISTTSTIRKDDYEVALAKWRRAFRFRPIQFFGRWYNGNESIY